MQANPSFLDLPGSNCPDSPVVLSLSQPTGLLQSSALASMPRKQSSQGTWRARLILTLDTGRVLPHRDREWGNHWRRGRAAETWLRGPGRTG